MTDDVVAELDRRLGTYDADQFWETVPPALVRRARDEIERLRGALEESVKLQRHYALLLNDYDGGKRIPFESAAAWMERLRALKDKRHD